jgi:hypothetical protein
MVYSAINGILGLKGPRVSWSIAAVCFSAAFAVVLLKVAFWPKKKGVLAGS